MGADSVGDGKPLAREQNEGFSCVEDSFRQENSDGFLLFLPTSSDEGNSRGGENPIMCPDLAVATQVNFHTAAPHLLALW